mgnify:CR=1 FL=1
MDWYPLWNSLRIAAIIPLGCRPTGALNLSLPGLRSQGIINCLQDHDIYVSAGSACSRGHRSHVLEAMHLPPAVIDGSIRVSFSRDNTEADVDALCQALLHAKQTLKG